jgi:hypothetical protein
MKKLVITRDRRYFCRIYLQGKQAKTRKKLALGGAKDVRRTTGQI